MPNEEKVQELFKRLQEGALAFRDSETYKKFLLFQKNFWPYSFNNQMLIYIQLWMDKKIQPTFVAGFRTWQEEFGRYVKRGEKGIAILAPRITTFNYVTTHFTWHGEDVEIVMRLDQLEAFRKNRPGGTYKGIPLADVLDAYDKEATYSKGSGVIGFMVVYVFDVSQTEGRAFTPPRITTLLETATVPEKLITSIINIAKQSEDVVVNLDGEMFSEGMMGYYVPSERTIAIRRGVSTDQKFKTLLHELAHHFVKKAKLKLQTDQEELVAESVAFIASDHVGLDTTQYSIGYVASWTPEAETFDKMSSAIYELSKQMIKFLDRCGDVLEKPDTEVR